MDTEILQQLVWIKWLLGALLLMSAIGIAGVLAFGWALWRSGIRAARSMASSRPFRKQADDLFDRARYDEVRTLAQERIASHPGDGYAYWYHGKACYRLGNLETALASLRKAAEINPCWTEEYVAPLIDSIEAQKQNNKKRDPGEKEDSPHVG